MKAFVIVSLLLLGVAACSPVRVESTSQTPSVDFTAYKTYNFLDVTARNEAAFAGGSGLGIDHLKQAVAREMERRGYQRADSPDLWVNIGVVSEQKTQTRETTIRDAPRYIGQRRYHWESEQVPVREYTEGTATVDVVDAARNERIWQGVAASAIGKDASKLVERINEGIAAMFAQYPVLPR
ncbi:DUF4136 domain-containing protein [Hymenobacter chitinivorans]|uniref:Uncharacterized protein DUF4136 n=1 Tax=Hymenobacter chitinivorans DSM 11115 TaxID=1121954 RepID=A0A2M9BTG8_9BACT|nr:DUF4136 domain-containing protein [Hymenobacter chitinivorans]PJJ61237.1 uncharacterized protein DUF4136 [Hymenobacter chitinivorans DSM 11115]